MPELLLYMFFLILRNTFFLFKKMEDIERSPESEQKVNDRSAHWNEYIINYRRNQKERIDKTMTKY